MSFSVGNISYRFIRDREIVDEFDKIIKRSKKKKIVLETEDFFQEGFSESEISEVEIRQWSIAKTDLHIYASIQELRNLFPMTDWKFEKDDQDRIWKYSLTFRIK